MDNIVKQLKIYKNVNLILKLFQIKIMKVHKLQEIYLRENIIMSFQINNKYLKMNLIKNTMINHNL